MRNTSVGVIILRESSKRTNGPALPGRAIKQSPLLQVASSFLPVFEPDPVATHPSDYRG